MEIGVLVCVSYLKRLKNCYGRWKIVCVKCFGEQFCLTRFSAHTTSLMASKAYCVVMAKPTYTIPGWPDPPEADSLRILFWTMYMVGLVVIAAYSATLVSFLTVADTGLPFDSLAELKKLGGYRLGILKGSGMEEYFKVSANGILHEGGGGGMGKRVHSSSSSYFNDKSYVYTRMRHIFSCLSSFRIFSMT